MTIRISFIGVLCFMAISRVDAEKGQPILAIFNIEARKVDLHTATINHLEDYMVSMLAANGYHVIPRSQVKSRLRAQKNESYKMCYDQACQIELGRELAAQKSLATQLIKIGKECKVTMTLYDLKRATSETGSVVSGMCDEQSIVRSFESAVAKLVRKGEPISAPQSGNLSGMSPKLTQPGTNLHWLRCAIGQKWNGASCVGSPEEMNWYKSRKACPKGYRLPTRSEILNLLGGCSRIVRRGGSGHCRSCRQSSYCAMLFGDETGYFWTSEFSKTNDSAAWRVSFDSGHVISHSKYFKHAVRCVSQ